MANNVISLIDPREAVEKAKKDIELLTLILENTLDENARLKEIIIDDKKTELITAKEAKEIYGLSEYQVRELGKQGIIGEVPFGGSKKFIVDDIEAYINSFRKTAKAV